MVTGACGFLGSHLCERLIRFHGHEVIGIDNGIIGKEVNVSGIIGNPLFRLEWMDVCHKFDLGPIDGIFHMASPTAPAETYRHSELTLSVNSKATIQLLELAEKYNAKFLFASSVKVHDRVNFGAAYIQGKILGEKFCEASVSAAV
jgi:dTDP-glucose 4,6-dehydratase